MRKKIGLVVFLWVAFMGHSNAQMGLRMGLNGGPTFSRAGTSIDSVPENYKIKTNIGYTLGFQLHYGFSDVIGLETGFNFVSKGYTIKNDTNSIEKNLKSSMTDFEIPINFTLRQELSSYSFVREKVGFTLGMHSEKEAYVNQTNAGDNANFGVTETFSKKLFPMFNLGIEYGYLTDNGNSIMVGINYTQGLGENVGLIFHNNNDYSGNLFDLNYRGSHLAIKFTYLFSLSNIGSSDEYFFE